MLPEAKDRFERYNKSRRAYSRAKTAVIYLPDKVIGADRKAAFKLVEEAHQELHYAETFERLIIDKGYLYWFKVPKLWVLYNYWQIVAVAEVLRNTDWDSTKAKNKLSKRLQGAVKVVDDAFGATGEKCDLHEWGLRDANRWENDDNLEKRYEREDELKRGIEQYLKLRG